MASPTPAGKKAGGLSWPSKPEDLAFVKRLGRGYFGEVWQCRLVGSQADAAPIAVKKVPLAMIQQHSLMEQMDREIAILRSLRHQHIVELFFDFRDNSHVYLGMEFAEGGGMFDLLSRTGTFSNELAAQYFYEVCDALRYLHNLPEKVIHRDIKPENVMFTDNQKKQVKIIDFGFAKFWDHNSTMSQACGSPYFVAPEVLRKSYTEKADMWSLGVVAWMLLTGSPPFSSNENAILQRKIKTCDINYNSHFYRLSPTAKDFLRSLLVLDCRTRLSAQEALDHPWIKTRHEVQVTPIDGGILSSLRSYANSSQFRRNLLSMMAWSLSTEARAELQSQFLAFDKDKKGTIQWQDLQAIMMEKSQIDEQEARKLFESMDADQSEEIEYSEFLAAALVGHVKVHEDVFRQTFQRFDVDGNGKIDDNELYAVLGEAFSEEDIKELINEADTSRDGMIDYEEFLAYFYKVDSETGSEGRDERRRKRTEKLGHVIDKLVRTSGAHRTQAFEDEVTVSKKPKWFRSKTAPPSVLPTLLGGMAPTEKL
mmetsp:Transcript_37666/g.97411  ORF Transcript_37666/g.97411 Transcript_37666/m.97411 type:complete len:538 (+) Transcript_37666:71-1684(+)